MIEPKLMSAEELAAAASLATTVRPYAWTAEAMGGAHYSIAEEAVETVPSLLAHIAAQDQRIAGLDHLAAALDENERLRAALLELREYRSADAKVAVDAIDAILAPELPTDAGPPGKIG